MNGKTHGIVAAISSFVIMIIWLCLIQYFKTQTISIAELLNNWKLILLTLPIGFYFGIFPDIDHKMSYVTWLNMGIGILTAIIGYFTNKNLILIAGIIICATSFIFAVIIPHRGLTHTIWFVLLTPLLLLFLPIENKIFIIIISMWSGIIHLLLDSIKKRGETNNSKLNAGSI